jgi:phage-related protein
MAVIATAEVRVVADTSRFISNLRRQLRGAFSGLGGNLGRDLGRDIADAASREVSNGLNRGLSRVRLNLPATLERQLATLFQGPFIQAGLSATSSLTDGMLRNENEVREAANRLSQLFAASFAANDLIDRGMLRAGLNGVVVDFGNAAFFASQTFSERFANSLRGRLARIDAAITGVFSRAMERVGNTAADAITGALQQRMRQRARPVALNFGLAMRQGLESSAQTVGNAFSQRLGDVLAAGARSAGNQLILGLLNRLRGGGADVENEGRSAGRRFGTALVGGLTTGLRGFGQALSSISLRPLQGLAGILGNATSEMISMAAQALVVVGLLESLSGALFALPAVLNVVGAGVATVAIAFNGFGAAIGAAFEDTAAFEEALEGLAPAAQAVAREFQAIAPALSDLQLGAQEALFSQLTGTITAVADNLLGPLSDGLNAAAASFGGIVAGIGEFLAQSATAGTVTATFETLVAIFDALAVSTVPFLEAMRLLADTFLPRIAEAAGPLAGLGAQFQAWTEQVVASGEAMAAFDFAIQVFQQLAGVVASLAGIFQAMFSAAELAGVDALGAIGEALAVVRTTFESFEGQVALANVFGAIGDAVNALAPVFATLVSQLGLVFPIIAQIAEALGPSLSVVLEGLGQALLALGPGVIEIFSGIAAAAEAIAPSLAPLGEALGAVLSAVAPLLPVIGQLIGIVVELGAQIIGVLASAIAPIVDALASSLGPILPQIAELFSQLVTAVAPLIEALGAGLASVISTLIPPILELVLALAGALMPIFEAILPVLTPILDIFFQLVNVIGSLLVPVISILLPIIEALSPLFQLIGVVLAPLLELFAAILEPITTLITLLASFLTPIIEFLAEVIGAIINVALVPLTAAFEFLADILADHVIPWFEASTLILQLFWQVAIQPLIEWIGRLTSAVSSKFGTVRDAVTTLWNTWRSNFDKVMNIIGDLIDTVQDMYNDVRGWLENLGEVFTNIFEGDIVGAVQSAANLIGDAVDDILGWVSDAVNAVSNLGDLDLSPFANGGIVTSPTAALIGEAGKEVVIPLTRPGRAVELAQQSGLIDLLAAQGALGGAATSSAPAGPVVGEMHVHSQTADAEQVARKALRILERRMGGRGLERTS